MGQIEKKQSGREAILRAFDQLFEHAAHKLNISCSDQEKQEARRDFAERSAAALEIIDKLDFDSVPEEVMQAMREAIDGLTPAQLVGNLAGLPLMQQTHDMLRQLAYQAAQQHLLEQIISQADDKYGGN